MQICKQMKYKESAAQQRELFFVNNTHNEPKIGPRSTYLVPL